MDFTKSKPQLILKFLYLRINLNFGKQYQNFNTLLSVSINDKSVCKESELEI